MWPELCTLPGGTVIHTYGLASALALGVLVFGAARMAPSFGVERESVYDIGLLSTFGGIAGSRLEHVRTNWHLYSEDLGGIFAREGGHVFYGGLIANLVLVVAYFAWKRRSPGPMLGLLAPFIALGLGIGRLGCLAAGCCYGAPTDMPWGIVFPGGDIAPSGIPLHPTQLT
ncbi:MAG: prolipoprotein diacylglyceryl transferase, partial [Myxococcota bacterium]|nr:prolipoprotein diacylglyceryl transferase [Myxococcota bacterium]